MTFKKEVKIMRMRKKKNLEARLEEVKEYILHTECEEKDFEKDVDASKLWKKIVHKLQ